MTLAVRGTASAQVGIGTAPAPWRILAGAAISGLAAAGMGVAILVQEPEYERAAAFALAGAVLYGIAAAVLRRAVVAGLALLEGLALLAFVSGVLVLRSQSPLLLFVVGLSGSLLVFMIAQVVRPHGLDPKRADRAYRSYRGRTPAVARVRDGRRARGLG
jgi:hypothetical protein